VEQMTVLMFLSAICVCVSLSSRNACRMVCCSFVRLLYFCSVVSVWNFVFVLMSVVMFAMISVAVSLWCCLLVVSLCICVMCFVSELMFRVIVCLICWLYVLWLECGMNLCDFCSMSCSVGVILVVSGVRLMYLWSLCSMICFVVVVVSGMLMEGVLVLVCVGVVV
jgi:hypothetical protein